MITKRDKEILKFIEHYKSITPNQCSKLFYSGNYSYDMARKRLSHLYKEGILKRYRKNMNSECFYYMDKYLSIHDSKAIDVMAEAKHIGGKIISFERKYRLLSYELDALLEVEYKGYIFPFIIEVDYTHFTSLKKLDDIYNSGYFQDKYKDLGENIFPGVVIIKPYSGSCLQSNLYYIYHLDFELNNLCSIFL